MSASNNNTKPNEEHNTEMKFTLLEICKLIFGFCITMLLVLVAFTGIAMQWCVLETPPAASFVLLFFALTLLAYVEALHYACVSVEKWDMTKYEHQFPRAYRVYKLVDTPEKVKKFLVGRQFFVIFVVFLIAQLTSFPGIPPDFIGMPHAMVVVLVQTGLPGVALTLNFGQLISQIYVEQYTLQFLDMYGCEFVTRLSLFTEYIGVCHFSWLLYHVSSILACKSVLDAKKTMRTMKSTDGMLENGDSSARPNSPTEFNRQQEAQKLGRTYEVDCDLEDDKPLTAFDGFRYLWSTIATLAAIMIILYGILKGVYVLPTPPGATYVILACVLTILFYLEGLMIAIVATQYWDRESFKDVYPRAYALHELINRPDNVKRFIIGRQACTVCTGFLIAQITTFHTWSSDGYNPILFYIVVKSGLVGVLLVLSVGQLMPELLAQEFPLRFMNLPGSYTIGAISLYADSVCVGHCAWAIYFMTRSFACKKFISSDEVKETKPEIMRINSAELMAVTGSPSGKLYETMK